MGRCPDTDSDLNLPSVMLVTKTISSQLCNLLNYPLRDKAWPSACCC